MLVGLTYDLKDEYLKSGYDPEIVAEFDSLQTIEAIDRTLQDLGYDTVRIGNIGSLVRFLADGNRCDLVFNIAEGLYGMAREAQIPALLDAYAIPHVFSDALVLALALHKGMAKAVVSASGVPTPCYRVLSDIGEAEQLDLCFPLFLKPVGGGTGMGISERSVVRDRAALVAETANLLSAFGQPVLAETFLDGPEYTVGIVGCEKQAVALAVMQILVDPKSDGGVYSYKTKQEYRQSARYALVDGAVARQCEQVALDAWRALGCSDGGRVDLKADKQGRICFLEANPLAGLNPVDSDLPILCALANIEYRELIARIMRSATERIGRDAHNHRP
jgi:D-alanine-D-alanine ligase